MLKKITVVEKNGKGKVIRRRHRYVQASHAFVETTQGGDRGYGDPSPRGQGYQVERTSAAPAADNAATADLERQNTKLREREAALLKRIEALEGDVDQLKARVTAIEDRPAGEGRDNSAVAGEVLKMRDRIVHLENEHGKDIEELGRAMARLGNAAAAQVGRG